MSFLICFAVQGEIVQAYAYHQVGGKLNSLLPAVCIQNCTLREYSGFHIFYSVSYQASVTC